MSEIVVLPAAGPAVPLPSHTERSTQSTIGIALIVKDDTAGLRAILPQLCTAACKVTGRLIFDEIVVLGQHDTPQETVDAAMEFPRVIVSTDYEWIDDFGDKRRQSFALLQTDWKGWCDTDDIWQGIEQLRTILGNMEADAPGADALWCRYYYDRHLDSGQDIAEHDRERFIKASSSWEWKIAQEVHEHMSVPNGQTFQMAFAHGLSVLHQRDVSRDGERNLRNLRILRKAKHKRPDDSRIYFDLGSQYYHSGRWARSLACYRHFLRIHKGPVERYQALHRMADSCRMLTGLNVKNLLVQAEEYEREAIVVMPNWKDAWFGLAELAMLKGEWQMSLNYAAMADRERYGKYAKPLDKPNSLLVLNSLDYTLHADIAAHRALGALGRIEDALEVVERAYALVPQHPEMLQARQVYTNITLETKATAAALEIGRIMPDDQEKYELGGRLPASLRAKKEIRDALIAPWLLKDRRRADVSIWCGASLDDWGPPTPHRTGIGGSETAVIEMAARLARRGLSVDVYNQCGQYEGNWQEAGCAPVRYLDHTRFDPTLGTKLFIAWRNPDIIRTNPKADQRWLWAHDLHMGPQGFLPAHAEAFDPIRPVSAWHGQHLEWLYPFLKGTGKIAPTRNGVDLTRFLDTTRECHPHRMIWASSADRGLEHILAMWGEVRARVPDAELHVFYGWDNIDKVIVQNQDHALFAFKNAIMAKAQQPGVIWRGRVSQHVLAEEYLQAAVLPYTSHFLETNCISAVEAFAAGCVVQSTICGAIPETTAGAAVLVRGHPASQAYRNAFLRNLLVLLTKPGATAEWVERGKARAAQLTWDGVVDEWVARIEGVPHATPVYTMGAATADAA